MQLPVEIIEKIVLYSQDLRVAEILRDHVSRFVFDKLERNILIYGNVQGGKTKAIIDVLKDSRHKEVPKVLVIQNSLLVLNQYIERLRREGIVFNVVDANKKIDYSSDEVWIIMNNNYRYTEFSKLGIKNYILILDEADQTMVRCPLVANKTYYVTATPYSKRITSIKFDKVIQVEKHPNYYGLERLNVSESEDYNAVAQQYFEDNSSKGLMLISKYTFVSEMTACALDLSERHPDVPVVLLTSEKYIFLNNTKKRCRINKLTKIIDKFSEYTHVILIANRLANRGLSYTSSDYSRHITYQLTKVKTDKTNFLQNLRILGIFKDSCNLKLFINKQTLFDTYMGFYNEFDVSKLLRVN